MLCKIIESVTDVCIMEENLFVNVQACITFNTGLFIMWPTRCFLTTWKLKLIFTLVVLNMHKQVCLVQASRSSFFCFNVAFCFSLFIYLFFFSVFNQGLVFIGHTWSMEWESISFSFFGSEKPTGPHNTQDLKKCYPPHPASQRAWLLDGAQHKGNTEDGSCNHLYSFMPRTILSQNIHEFGAASNVPNSFMWDFLAWRPGWTIITWRQIENTVGRFPEECVLPSTRKHCPGTPLLPVK